MGGKVWDLKVTRVYNRGIEKGIERGIEKGLKRGRAEGQNDKAVQVYKNCIARGMSKADAIAISEIPKDLLRLIEKQRE